MYWSAFLSISVLIAQAEAIPTYFSKYYIKEAKCAIPEQGYNNHGDPVQNERITFALHNSKGEMVTAWNTGEVFQLSTAHAAGLSMQAVVVASIGTLNVTGVDEEGKVGLHGFQTPDCKNAWGSLRQNENHTMRWESPSEVPTGGLCAEFSVAQANGGHAAYQVNTAIMCSSTWDTGGIGDTIVDSQPQQEQDEDAKSLQEEDAPRLLGRGRLEYGNGIFHGLNWSHVLLLAVLSIGAISAAVYRTSTK